MGCEHSKELSDENKRLREEISTYKAYYKSSNESEKHQQLKWHIRKLEHEIQNVNYCVSQKDTEILKTKKLIKKAQDFNEGLKLQLAELKQEKEALEKNLGKKWIILINMGCGQSKTSLIEGIYERKTQLLYETTSLEDKKSSISN